VSSPRGKAVAAKAVAAKAASLLLRYPDAETLSALPVLTDALADLPEPVAGPLRIVAGHRAATPPGELAPEYVATFDFRRRCCLHLTYYTCGDTRRRGEALVAFAHAHKAAGVEVTGGELPDFLPAVLELAAGPDPTGGWALLRAHRVGLDLLAEALATDRSVYRHAVLAVLELLPAPSRSDRDAAVALAHRGPPVEQVGLPQAGSVSAAGPFGLTVPSGGRR
jgi:nitrate reductase delta subunit